jgi:tetratricopeptide (TPR) repeat protein
VEDYFMIKKLSIISLIFVFVFFSACSGPKERKAESHLDTPEYHYTQGKKYLEKDDLTNALREFNEAKSLKANFAPAYEGIAIVEIEQKNFAQADENINTSLSEDGDWVPAMVAQGRWYSAQSEYEDAIDEFESALDDIDDSKSSFDKKEVRMDALYHMGVAYKEWGQYIPAQTTFQKILEIDNTNVKASLAIKELAEYQAAVAGQSPVLQKIAPNFPWRKYSVNLNVLNLYNTEHLTVASWVKRKKKKVLRRLLQMYRIAIGPGHLSKRPFRLELLKNILTEVSSRIKK